LSFPEIQCPEIEGVYQGMMIVVGNEHWIVFRDMPPGDLVRLLKKLAGKVKLSKYKKHPRGPSMCNRSLFKYVLRTSFGTSGGHPGYTVVIEVVNGRNQWFTIGTVDAGHTSSRPLDKTPVTDAAFWTFA
jgi:hypothetical protein